jgi:hypothetical protein
MNILSAGSLHALQSKMAEKYAAATIEPAPGDAGRWFVLRDGYVMTGVHILQKGADRYVFCTIP